MPSRLKIGLSQSPTLPTTSSTLEALRTQTHLASKHDISILLFPEAYLGGYPRSCTFGSAIGSRTPAGRDQYLAYLKSAVDLGDTFRGEEDDWINRENGSASVGKQRGDGTREIIESIARETGVFIVTGLVEKVGTGSLFCSALFVDPTRGVIAKRRKVQPTGTERLVWSQGSPSSLRAVAVDVRGVRVVMGAAICWENYMPLLRYSLYAQGVNLWLAPTADARETWESLMKTVAIEGRTFILSCNQAQRVRELPGWATGRVEEQKKEEEGEKKVNGERTTTKPALASTGDGDGDEWASRGGSCIIDPFGKTIAGPLWEEQDLLFTEVDFEDCERGKLDFDVAGHYARSDVFRLEVEGLDLVPPP